MLKTILRRFRRAGTSSDAARRLYDALVSRSRAPVFHRQFAVPDTIDGRFDLLAAHAFLVLKALPPSGPGGRELAAELVDLIFAGFDDALRELGVSDFGIARRMKAMASAFYGRLEAYREASARGELEEALLRNLYRGKAPAGREAAKLADYMVAAERHLHASTQDLLSGDANFGPLPQP